MKKFTLILVLLYGSISSAQNIEPRQLSFDLNYGISMPITPIPDGRKAGDFTGYNSVFVGARYMINPKIGFRIGYSYIKFEDKNSPIDNLTYNIFDLQIVSNLAYFFGDNSNFYTKFGLLVHGGGGLTYAKSSIIKNKERVGTIIFGLTPLYQLSTKFDINIDVSYVVTLKQHFGFDNQLINPNFEAQTGSFMNFSIGFIYNIAQNSQQKSEVFNM